MLQRRLLCLALAVLLAAARIAGGACAAAETGSVPAPEAARTAEAEPQEGTPVSVPILMYHSVLERENGSVYCISEERFRADLCWLKEKGYETVFVSDLVRWAREGTPLPEKPVVITLDDGFLNAKTAVLPLLEELDMKAVVSVVGEYTERAVQENDPDPRYAYLTWEDIAALAASGRVEIGNHTFAMHGLEGRRGCARLPGEEETAYQSALREDLSRLQAQLAEKSGVTPVCFAYPYGAVSEAALPVLRELGFQAALTCEERVNLLTGDPEELYHLGRFNRPAGVETEAFFAELGL